MHFLDYILRQIGVLFLVGLLAYSNTSTSPGYIFFYRLKRTEVSAMVSKPEVLGCRKSLMAYTQ